MTKHELDPFAISCHMILPNTETGDDLSTVVPSPNCPYVFLPQDHAVPFNFNTVVWPPPALIWHQSVKPPTTDIGDLLETVVPLPNSPHEFLPHDHAVPLFLKAME